MTKFQTSLVILLSLFIVWLFLYSYMNRYAIIPAHQAYKLDRVKGHLNFIDSTVEYDIWPSEFVEAAKAKK